MSRRTKPVTNANGEPPFSTLLNAPEVAETEDSTITVRASDILPVWAIPSVDEAYFKLSAEKAVQLGGMQEDTHTRHAVLDGAVYGLLKGDVTAEMVEACAAEVIARLVRVVEMARLKAGSLTVKLNQ